MLACRREEILISTQLRLAAGTCVLSAGLLIGSAGGGIAAADTDTNGSAPASNADATSATTSTNESPASPATPTPGSAFQTTVTNTLTFIGKLGQQQAAATKRQLTNTEAAATEDKKKADLTDDSVAPLATDSTEVAPETPYVAPVTEQAVEPATDPMAPVSTVVKPMTNAVVTVVGVMASVPGAVAALPASETPVTDVITTMQTMLTTVTDAVVPLVSVPSDLYTLLAGAQVATPTTIGGGASFSFGPVPVADAPLLPPVMPAWPQVVPSSDIWAAHGDVIALASGEVATAGLNDELSISGTAPLAPAGATPSGVLPVLEHAVAALLVPVSLSTLAALAIPGVAGLLVVCAAGIRIGYRQAKAGLMLRASGLARFAGSGPLGVVRSGSLIALRSRAVRVGHPTATRTTGLLDQIG